MSLINRVVLVVVALLLTSSLVAANGVLLVQRTAADEAFVTNALDEADAYDALYTEFLASDAFAVDGDGDHDEFVDEELLSQLVTPIYLQNQVEANVERTYAYLHGDREDLVLEFDLRPVKERAPDAIAAYVESRELSELVQRTGAAGTSTDASLENTSLTTEQVFSLGDNRSQYESVREQFRADLRENVVEGATEEAFVEATNDELLALVIENYDPDEYTDEEKEQLVDERESEIRDAIATTIREERGDEIDERIDERLTEIVDEARDAAEDEDDPMAAATASLYRTHVVGLAGEQSFDEFRETRDAVTARFAAAVGNQVAGEMDDELPDRFDLTGEMDDGAMEVFETARQAVGILNVLVFLLPLLAAVFAGTLWWVSASGLQAAWWGGIATVIGGVTWVVGLLLADRHLAGTFESMGGDAGGLGGILEALVQGMLSVGMTQSVGIVIAGGLLVVASLAVQFDVLGVPE